MNYGKHAPSSRRRNRKPVALLLAVVLLLGLAIGGTVAYLVTRTDPVNNTFTPTHVSCEVEKTSDGFTVKNTGDIDAYIKAYVTANYINGDGHVCAAHTVTVSASGSDWTEENGVFYYAKPVSATESTGKLTVSVTPETVSDGCTLNIEAFASAIQPGDAAVSAWKGGSGS